MLTHCIGLGLSWVNRKSWTTLPCSCWVCLCTHIEFWSVDRIHLQEIEWDATGVRWLQETKMQALGMRVRCLLAVCNRAELEAFLSADGGVSWPMYLSPPSVNPQEPDSTKALVAIGTLDIQVRPFTFALLRPKRLELLLVVWVFFNFVGENQSNLSCYQCGVWQLRCCSC